MRTSAGSAFMSTFLVGGGPAESMAKLGPISDSSGTVVIDTP